MSLKVDEIRTIILSYSAGAQILADKGVQGALNVVRLAECFVRGIEHPDGLDKYHKKLDVVTFIHRVSEVLGYPPSEPIQHETQYGPDSELARLRRVVEAAQGLLLFTDDGVPVPRFGDTRKFWCVCQLEEDYPYALYECRVPEDIEELSQYDGSDVDWIVEGAEDTNWDGEGTYEWFGVWLDKKLAEDKLAALSRPGEKEE